MNAPAKHFTRPAAGNQGFTLVELLVVVGVTALVCVVVSGVMLSTSRLYNRTTRRAEVQMSTRQAVSLMTTELRQAGADPGDPQMGLAAIVTADDDQIRVRADLNGDGVLQTAEPSEDVTYRFDSAAREITRDPGSGAELLMANVTSMTLTYYDAANQPLGPLPLSTSNAALVRAVGLTITSEDRDSRSITLATRIALRNL